MNGMKVVTLHLTKTETCEEGTLTKDTEEIISRFARAVLSGEKKEAVGALVECTNRLYNEMACKFLDIGQKEITTACSTHIKE